ASAPPVNGFITRSTPDRTRRDPFVQGLRGDGGTSNRVIRRRLRVRWRSRDPGEEAGTIPRNELVSDVVVHRLDRAWYPRSFPYRDRLPHPQANRIRSKRLIFFRAGTG